MTVVSSREFASNQSKYYNLAVDNDIFIKRGKNTFRLMRTSEDNTAVRKRVYYEPDEDFYRSVSIDELKEQSREFIHKLFANKEMEEKKNLTKNFLEGFVNSRRL